jgi:hypothetical protein
MTPTSVMVAITLVTRFFGALQSCGWHPNTSWGAIVAMASRTKLVVRWKPGVLETPSPAEISLVASVLDELYGLDLPREAMPPGMRNRLPG